MQNTDQSRLKALFGDEFEKDPVGSTRELLEEEAFRLTHEKFRYYEPNGKCEQFIRAIGKGERFIVFMSAANGVGKTAAAANVVANILFDNPDNEWFEYPLFTKWPFPKRGRIVSEASNVIKNVVPALEDWLPLGRYKASKGRKEYLSQWETDTGFSFDIMTNDQDPKQFEGPTLGWVWFDEPPTEAIFKACVSRLRKGGIMFITATPLNGSAWMYDEIVAKAGKETEVDGRKGILIEHIEAGVEAACKTHGERGHLEHAEIEKMTALYSEEDKQARIHGKFQHLVGLRFKRFTRKIHVIRPFEVNAKDFTVYHSLDPHPRNPDAGLWLAVDRKGTKFVVDEIYLKCEGATDELARRIKEKNSNYRMERMTIDPSAAIEDQHTGKSLVSRLHEKGLTYIAATKARTQADKRIEDALAFTQLPGHDEMLKAPEVYIFDTCQRLIWEFEHYRWDEWTGKSAEKHSEKQKTLDKDDHAIECLGRLLYQEPQFFEAPVYTTGNVGQSNEPNYDPFES